MADDKRTVSGTQEWAATNVNIQRGCSHGCVYCYAHANAQRFKQLGDGQTWGEEVINRTAVEKAYGFRPSGTIMFPTTHDIVPANLDEATTVLRKMLASGNRVLVVSKPHLACIQRLCAELEEWKDNVLFRFTIGAMRDETLLFWEPGAPAFEEPRAP